jgi:hypothetical protein
MDWLDINRPGRSFHPLTTNLINARGHRVVFRAPYWYWSCDGAIEYVFNTLQTRLQMEINGVDSVFQLVNKINVIIGGMPSFKRYFLHLGFPDN